MQQNLGRWLTTQLTDRPVAHWKPGRTCRYCGKVLSIYNPDHHCNACNLRHRDIMLNRWQNYYQIRKARQS